MGSTGTEGPVPPTTPAGGGGLPTFLIIGAMRSGTTSLTRYLRPHPDVYMADRKELHFFDFDYGLGIERYRENFEGAGDALAVGEATPNYMYDGRAMERIAVSIPGARLVAILRDPVDRAYSHYWHNRSVGRESLGFAEALAAEQKRLSTDDPRARAHWSYVDRGRYHRQLLRVSELFPREALLVLLFDDLKDAPSEVHRTLYRHLGIDDRFSPTQSGITANTFVAFRSKTVRRLTRRLPRSTRRVVGRLNTRSDSSYPPMDPAIRHELKERFQQENALLGAWLRRDLSPWDR
jgi:hypothetical protein